MPGKSSPAGPLADASINDHVDYFHLNGDRLSRPDTLWNHELRAFCVGAVAVPAVNREIPRLVAGKVADQQDVEWIRRVASDAFSQPGAECIPPGQVGSIAAALQRLWSASGLAESVDE